MTASNLRVTHPKETFFRMKIGNDLFTLDLDDEARVSRHKWYVHQRGAITEIKIKRRRRYILLHRFLAGATRPNQVVIFKDTNKLNCRKDNLVLMSKKRHNTEYRKWHRRDGSFCGGSQVVKHPSGGRYYRYIIARFRGKKKYFPLPLNLTGSDDFIARFTHKIQQRKADRWLAQQRKAELNTRPAKRTQDKVASGG